ncbi:MAG: FAD:protein FMN transferase [Paracoccus sp. (in: a-proteobacteria)]|nr:FAD:protein FMN transferase [Paracoccus sp. (in: a-proteobacteria)]
MKLTDARHPTAARARATRMTRRGLIWGTGAALGGAVMLRAAPSLAAPAIAHGAAPVQTIGGPAFGSRWQVSLPAGRDAARLGPAIARALDLTDRRFSPWRADSEIGRVNRAGTGGHAVSAETAAMVAAALALKGDSGGAFDPGVGPLVARWGFGPIGQGRPGLDGLQVGADEIIKTDAAQTLDLCGIAKGDALDHLAALMVAAGENDFLIDLGGEVMARGRHPSGRHWQIAIEDPRPGHEGAAEVLALDGLTVATSGDRVNAYDLGGQRISHIIDPVTGAPAAGGVASVSVIMASGAQADGWATALMAAGPQRGPELAAARGLAALFLIHRPEGGLMRIDSPALAPHLA